MIAAEYFLHYKWKTASLVNFGFTDRLKNHHEKPIFIFYFLFHGKLESCVTALIGSHPGRARVNDGTAPFWFDRNRQHRTFFPVLTQMTLQHLRHHHGM